MPMEEPPPPLCNCNTATMRPGPGRVTVTICLLILVTVAAWAGFSPVVVVELLIGSGVLTTWVYESSPQAGPVSAQV